MYLSNTYQKRCRKSNSMKKNSNKKLGTSKILGTQILSYEKFYCKIMEISEENKLYPAK